jgi:hypothetical protein
MAGGKRANGGVLGEMSIVILAAAVTLCSVAMANAVTVCNVRAYGAKADGRTMNTSAIQTAIDVCAKKGGGRVRLDGGTFLSGPIVLKSNINLDIAKGTTLQGSSNHDDYPKKTEFRNPGLQSLVSATDASNISITGGGVIDGAGESWWKEARTKGDHGIMGQGMLRPRLIVFDHCHKILMEGVTVQNSPFWQIVAYYSDDVTIRNIRVLADPPLRIRMRSIPSPPAISESSMSMPMWETTMWRSNPARPTRPDRMRRAKISLSRTAPLCTGMVCPLAARCPAACKTFK